MSTPDLKVDITMEAGLHKAMKNFAEHVMSKYGLQIESVRFDWLEIRNGVGAQIMSQIHHVSIETKTHGDNR